MIRDTHTQIDTLNAQSRSLRERASKEALELAEQAHALARVANDIRGQIESLINQSHARTWLSDFAIALSQSLEALKAQEDVGDPALHADALLALARVHLKLSNFTESVDACEQARRLSQECGDVQLEADACNVIGINCYRLNMNDRAFACYEDAIRLYQQIGNAEGVCKVLVNVAQSWVALKHYDRALTIAREGIELARTISSPMLESYTLLTSGQVLMHQQEYALALGSLHDALHITLDIGNQHLALVVMMTIGRNYLQQRKYAPTFAYLSRALEQAEALKSMFYVARCHELLSEYHEHQHAWQQALVHYKQFHRLKEQVFDEMTVHRFQSLEIVHQIETARQQAEIYHLRNVALEQEIAERKRLEAELQHQATTDVLTGAANRRRFLEVADIELQRAIRHQRPLTMALIDLDFLKGMNDTHGHAAGDTALLTLARVFLAHIRTGDTFARIGGDEFALLLPDTTIAQACEVIERIRVLLGARHLAEHDGAAAILISVGVAEMGGPTDTIDGLLGRADRALYGAKRAGRNQIMVDAS